MEAAAADLSYGIFGWNTQSTNVTIFALNDKFYTTHNWAQNTGQNPYKPYPGYPTSGLTFTNAKGQDTTVALTNYAQSVARSTGIFQPAVLQAIDVKYGTQRYHERTVGIGRYNPQVDTGEGNKVWLTSIISDRGWGPPTDEKLIIYNKPLWQAFFGLWDWINIAKPKTQAFETSMFVVQSQFISRLTPTEQKVWPIIDYSFIQGKLPYGEDITKQDEALWYPTCMTQRETISAIVQSGPYIPKLSNIPQSTWQLNAKYTFYFKWGGPQVTEKNVQDPQGISTYPIPNNLWETIKITNPQKQHCKQILRTWDFRRGIATKRALKRMQENLSTDSSIQSDDSETPKRKEDNIRNALPRPTGRKDPEMSPLTLRRRFLPRRNGRHQPAHPTATQAPAAAQEKPHPAPHEFKEKSETPTNANRPRVRRFKPGFEQETERELSIIFRRPPRTYFYDPPFYPWLPPEPRVNFNLNFQY